MRGPDPRIHDVIIGPGGNVVDGRGTPGHDDRLQTRGRRLPIGPNPTVGPDPFLFTMSNSVLSPFAAMRTDTITENSRKSINSYNRNYGNALIIAPKAGIQAIIRSAKPSTRGRKPSK